ncbi:MAG: endonuclease/exonuclease/phosphatase family protein [Gemmatimonadetes bacterium]|nr:endonuclease/exonuclease/phosphatase family protein [Gemmatimonadota bacterium]
MTTPTFAGSPYVIRCGGQGHKVGLDPGRFWRPARCPACHAAVDPFRLRRLWWWLRGQAPRSRLKVGATFLTPLDGIILLTAAGLALVSVLLRTGDRWWGGTVLLFSGRWPWLLPLGPLAVMALFSRRFLTVGLLLVPTLIGGLGVMGGSLGLGRLSGRGDPVATVRIITFNVAGGETAARHLAELVDDWQPDLVAIQECGPVMRSAMAAIRGYRSYSGVVCLLSRLPVQSVEQLPRKSVAEAGGSGMVIRYRIEGPRGPFDLTNVHLDTPRQGFESLLRGETSAPLTIEEGIVLRDIESRQARQWVEEGPGPRLVAGDFNLPSESAIYREHWGDLTEAFEAAGFGIGATRFNGWIRLRIDHVLADDSWVVRSARVLPDYGSDHRPLLADLERRR